MKPKLTEAAQVPSFTLAVPFETLNPPHGRETR